MGDEEGEEVERGEELVITAEAGVEAGALVVNGAVFGPIGESPEADSAGAPPRAREAGTGGRPQEG